MAAERELGIIIKLRKANTNELTKLDNEIKKFHDNVSRGSQKLSSGMSSSVKSVKELKSEIDRLSTSLGGIGKGAAESQIKLEGMNKKTAEYYSRIIKQTKQTEEMMNQLARSTLAAGEAASRASLSTEEYNSHLRRLTTTEYYQKLAKGNQSLSRAIEELTRVEKEQARTAEVTRQRSSELSSLYPVMIRETDLLAQAERNLGVQIKFSTDLQLAAQKLLVEGIVQRKIQSDSIRQGIATTNEVISSNKKMAASLEETSAAYQKSYAQSQQYYENVYRRTPELRTSISVINSLGEALRKIQVVGNIKGTSIFQQNIESTKIFHQELEKLRLKLAQVSSEKFLNMAAFDSKMISEFNALSSAIDTLAKKTDIIKTSFSEYSASLGRTGDKAQETSERLRTSLISVLNEAGAKLSEGTRSLNTFGAATNKVLNKVREDFIKSEDPINRLVNLYNEATKRMEVSLLSVSNVSGKFLSDEERKMAGLEAVFTKISGSLHKLESAYTELRAAHDQYLRGNVTFQQRQEAINNALREAGVVLSTLAPKYHGLANEVRGFVGTANSQISAFGEINTIINNTIGSVNRLTNEEKELGQVSQYTGKSILLLSQQLELSKTRSTLLFDTIQSLNSILNTFGVKGKMTQAELAALQTKVVALGASFRTARDHTKSLETELMQLQQRSGDTSRAMSRMSSEGFANMIISQAAWMAGFQVIFGSLDKLKKAFGEVVENQKAVARAMRTIRDDTSATGMTLADQSKIYDTLTDAINRMRAKVGASAQETGEDLYQLGSAGLKLNESLAALEPTMDTIIGSEGDMEQITSLVAGLYNNFGDQIVKLDGKVRTISNTFDGYNDSIVEAATLTEKFTRINDILIRTFDAHQAEMDQIRDGLKFLSQSARQANLSLEQQLGILATLHDHLIKAGAAGRGMRVILSRISKEAKLFKESFDLDIDLSKPMDLMNVLSQLHEKVKDNTLSVETLGVFFKRLGLRGVEPLLILIRHFDELNENIKDIIENSDNAAENMRKMRLDNLADQAKIAGERINVLLIKGMEPLADVSKKVVGIFNSLTSSVGESSNSVSKFLNVAMGLAGWAATVIGLSFALHNLRRVIAWVIEMLTFLVNKMREFGIQALEVNRRSREVAVGINSMGAASEISATKVSLLSKSFSWLKSLLSSIAWIAIIQGLYELIQTTSNYRRDLDLTSDALNKESNQIKLNIENLKSLGEKINSSASSSEDFRKSLQGIAFQLNINLKEYASEEEALGAINAELEKRIRLQEIAQRVSIEKALMTDLERAKVAIKDVNLEMERFTGNSIAQFMRMGASLNNYFVGVLTLNTQKMNESINDFADSLRNYGNMLDDAFLSKLERMKNSISRQIEISDKLDKAIKTLSKTITDFPELKTPEISNQIEELKKYKSAVDESIISIRKRVDALIADKKTSVEVRTELQQISDTLNKNKQVLAEDGKEVDKLAEKWSKAALNIQTAFDTINLSMERTDFIVKNLGQDFHDFSSAMEDFEKKAKLEDFKLEIQAISDQLSKLGSLGPTKMSKLLTSVSKLQVDGSKYLLDFSKEVYNLEKKLRELGYAIDKVTMDRFNRELDLSKTTIESLKNRFDIAGEKMKKFKNEADSSSAGMKSINSAANGLSSSMTMISSSTEKSSDSVEKSNKLSREQKKIQAEMAKEYDNMKSKIGEAINSEIEYIQKKQEEIKANGKTAKGLEDNRKNYEEIGSALDKIKTKLSEELEVTKARIKLDREMKKITESEAQKRLIAAEEKYIRELNALEQRQKELDALKISNIEALRAAEKAQYEERKKQIEELIELIKTLTTAMSQIVIHLVGSENVPEEIKKIAQKASEEMNKNPVDISFKTTEEILKKNHDEISAYLKANPPESGLSVNSESVAVEFERVRGIASDKLKDIPANVDQKGIEKPIKEGISLADKLNKDLGRTINKTVKIKVTGDKVPKNYWGGVIKRESGGIIPARVTNGEGYFPPGFASQNLNLLNTLNSGQTVSRVPSAVSTFRGPGGIDNIHTYLPTGSYVLSKRGMEAYEASIKKGAQTFQEGGEVSEPTASTSSSVSDYEKVGSFTIVVEKDGRYKNFPITGKVSVLKSLKAELEEDRLTRLH